MFNGFLYETAKKQKSFLQSGRISMNRFIVFFRSALSPSFFPLNSSILFFFFTPSMYVYVCFVCVAEA